MAAINFLTNLNITIQKSADITASCKIIPALSVADNSQFIPSCSRRSKYSQNLYLICNISGKRIEHDVSLLIKQVYIYIKFLLNAAFKRLDTLYFAFSVHLSGCFVQICSIKTLQCIECFAQDKQPHHTDL